MAGCIIQANTEIYENSIINTGVKIDHDCIIGKNVHIAPGVTLCGNVKVGDNSFIGAGVVGLPGTVIPSNSIIPAGDVLKNKCKNYDAYIFSMNNVLSKCIGLRTKRKYVLKNGKLDCRLLYFPIKEGKFQ